ncbi:hypothetical protein F2Q69_00045191 [Brassica cretica]|uniref:Uncharacterized protein n=1 Tax=Brassica cretica TaxID=69181 RepID=A0A8S9NKF8_BRACR|nr:hypothetical protein F2Q69_00045191 [Brassica cretica]
MTTAKAQSPPRNQLEKKDTKEENDEDLNSVAGPPTHEINHTSYIGASSNIGAFKEGYLCNHEEFDHETTCYRLLTQPEPASIWFHTKRRWFRIYTIYKSGNLHCIRTGSI